MIARTSPRVARPPAGHSRLPGSDGCSCRRRRPTRAAAGAGDLFVAIVGERDDGHDFAAGSRRGGAWYASAPGPPAAPTIVVAATASRPGRLASRRRSTAAEASGRRRHRLVGQDQRPRTCSPRCCGVRAATVAPEGSFNTEVGLPLTVLRATPRHPVRSSPRWARAGIGHVAATSARIAPPRRRRRAQRRLGAPRGVRQPRGHRARPRARSSRRSSPTAWPSSTPTTRSSPRWRSAAGAPIVTFGASPAADVRAVGLTLRRLRPAPGSPCTRRPGTPRCSWPWSASTWPPTRAPPPPSRCTSG